MLYKGIKIDYGPHRVAVTGQPLADDTVKKDGIIFISPVITEPEISMFQPQDIRHVSAEDHNLERALEG